MRQYAELVVDEREQHVESPTVALLDRPQQTGDGGCQRFGHPTLLRAESRVDANPKTRITRAGMGARPPGRDEVPLLV